MYIKARNNSKGIPSIWQAVVDYKMSASKSDSEMILYDKIEQISMDENQLEIVYMNKIYTCNSGLSDYEKWEWDSS
ncbi:hypothetical protein MASR2M78_23840 [Treponema sp.]